MPKFDTTTIEGRKEYLAYTVHESYLEGYDVDAQTVELLDDVLVGKITTKQALHMIAKSAIESTLNQK